MVNMLHVQNITLALIQAAMGKYTIGSNVVSETVHPDDLDAEMSMDEHNAYLAKIAEWCQLNRLPPLTSLICRNGVPAPGFWQAYPELQVTEEKRAFHQSMGAHFQKECFDFFDGVGVGNQALMSIIEERVNAIFEYDDQAVINALVRYGDSIGVVGIVPTSNSKLNVPPLQRPALYDWLHSHVQYDVIGKVCGYDAATIMTEEQRNTVVRSGVVPMNREIDLIGFLLSDYAGNAMFEFRQLEVKGAQRKDGSPMVGTFRARYEGSLGAGPRGWTYSVVQLSPEVPVLATIQFEPSTGRYVAIPNEGVTDLGGLIVEITVVATPFDDKPQETDSKGPAH